MANRKCRIKYFSNKSFFQGVAHKFYGRDIKLNIFKYILSLRCCSQMTTLLAHWAVLKWNSPLNEVLAKLNPWYFNHWFLQVILITRSCLVLIFVLITRPFYGRHIKSLHKRGELGICRNPKLAAGWVKRPVITKA